MVRRILLFVLCLVFYSCANRNAHLISFNIPDYNFEYLNPNKRINLEDNYILNFTNVQTQNGFKIQKLKISGLF
ncbi:MAG: hypothetical protein ACJAYY_002548 [Paraglaciecola sp.]|jgi:hypothetical protein